MELKKISFQNKEDVKKQDWMDELIKKCFTTCQHWKYNSFYDANQGINRYCRYVTDEKGNIYF